MCVINGVGAGSCTCHDRPVFVPLVGHWGAAGDDCREGVVGAHSYQCGGWCSDDDWWSFGADDIRGEGAIACGVCGGDCVSSIICELDIGNDEHGAGCTCKF